MKLCILEFSPSGHTNCVAEEIKKQAELAGHEVQLINITHMKEIHRSKNPMAFLQKIVLPHDVLCVGAPVYAGHFEHTLLSILEQLPSVDSTWGRFAAAFVTYGGVHSSIALADAAKALRNCGHTVIAGLKIRAMHTLSATFEKKLHPDEPSAESLALVKPFIETINQAFSANSTEDISASFDYAPEEERQLFQTHSQDDFHRDFRERTVDSSLCIGCQKCVAACPVNMYEMVQGKAAVTNSCSHCILCAECYHNCPAHAISFNYVEQVKPRLTKSTPEAVASAVFPAEK